MIRFRLAELIADRQFRQGRRVMLKEVAEATGINRATLSRMVNTRGYSTATDTLNKLCAYFDCPLSELAEYVRDPVQPTLKKSQTQAANVGRQRSRARR